MCKRKKAPLFTQNSLALQRGLTYTLVVQPFEASPTFCGVDRPGFLCRIPDGGPEEKEGEDMSLEAIEKINQVEKENQERRAAADAQAKQLVADAQRDGQALIQKTRTDAAEKGKEMLRQAEVRAQERSAQISAEANAQGDALRAEAAKHLEEAAEFIVGRVVNQ